MSSLRERLVEVGGLEGTAPLQRGRRHWGRFRAAYPFNTVAQNRSTGLVAQAEGAVLANGIAYLTDPRLTPI